MIIKWTTDDEGAIPVRDSEIPKAVEDIFKTYEIAPSLSVEVCQDLLVMYIRAEIKSRKLSGCVFIVDDIEYPIDSNGKFNQAYPKVLHSFDDALDRLLGI